MPTWRKVGGFLVPEHASREELVIAACASAADFTARVAECYRQQIAGREREPPLTFLHNLEEHFSDSETRIRIDRLISWAPHSTQLHGFYGAAPIHLLDPPEPLPPRVRALSRR
jgi:hypothetical protein